MSNELVIKKCDNELIIIAFQHDDGNPDDAKSFMIARLLGGQKYVKDFTVTIPIQPGQYMGGVFLQGVRQEIPSGEYPVQLAPGTYKLAVIGINWGKAAQYKIYFKTKENEEDGAKVAIPETDGPAVVSAKELKTFKVE